MEFVVMNCKGKYPDRGVKPEIGPTGRNLFSWEQETREFANSDDCCAERSRQLGDRCQHHQAVAPCIVYEFDFDRRGNKTYQRSFTIC